MSIKILVTCLILVLSIADDLESINQPLTNNQIDNNNDQKPQSVEESEIAKNEAKTKSNNLKGIQVAHLTNGESDKNNSDSTDSGMSVSIKIGIGIGSALGGLCFCFFVIKVKG